MSSAADPPSEPAWTLLEQEPATSYLRPMVGSEAFIFAWHAFEDGLGDVCLGITFKTVLAPDVFAEKLVAALCYLRFVSPLLASTIRKGVHDPDLSSWVYTPASGPLEVQRWATDTLQIIEEDILPNDFVTQTIATRLPYTRHDEAKQYFKLYLLKNTGEGMAIFVHGTHAIFDAHPNLNTFRILFEEITRGDSSHDVNNLAWGEEWRNLAPGPIAATGGPRPGWSTEGVSTLQTYLNTLSSKVPTHSLRPVRQKVDNIGKVTRVLKTLDRETSQRIMNGLKQIGHTVTHLFEAASILAMFAQNPEIEGGEEEAHVTLDVTFISLMRYLVAPHNELSHITSTSALVPIKVPYSVFRGQDGRLPQLRSILDCIRTEYSHYLSSPHLPHITSHISTLMPPRVAPSLTWPNQAALFITNIGVVDRLFPFKYYTGGDEAADTPVIEVDDLFFGHRLSHILRPVAHIWSVNGLIHLQLAWTDAWDEEYLREYSTKVVEFASMMATADFSMKRE